MAQSEIEDLMEQACDDSSKIGDFYAKLISSELYVLNEPQENSVDGRVILEADTQVSLVNFQMEDGTLYIPVFTSLAELQSTLQEEASYLALDGWNLFSLIRGTDVVINPTSPYVWPIKADEIDKILDYFGSKTMTVEEDTPVLIGQPEIDPVDLKNAVSDVFARDSRVQSAYLCLMVDQNTNEHSFVIGVVFRPDQEYREIFNIAGPAASKFLPEGHMLDFLVIEDSEGIAGVLLESGDCFYRSETQ